ncbi:MAG: hypothetical protein ABIP54_00120, partial [Candidatus Andersenbacteria bacterium]
PVVVWAILIIFLFLAFGMRLLQIQKKKKLHTDNIASILFIFSLILFAIIGSKLLIQQKDGLYTGIINAYGDVGWHTALITELAQAKTLPLQDPIFAGTSLTYPFLSNAISSAMLIIGSCIAPSMDAPAIILLPIIIVLLYHFGRIYGGSKKAGIIVLLLFLFGGATFGWTRIFGDIQQSNESLTQFITHLPHRDYSGVGGDADGFDFLNPVTSLLLPQRAMLFGLPIVLSVLILLSPVIIKKKYSAISAGILAGMLPLFHAHACIALAVTIIALFLASKQKKKYVQFLIPALIFGIPELFFYTHGDAQSGSFFRLAPGWMKGDINFFVFWIQNTGIILPASILVLFIKRIPIQARALSLAGLSLFALANIFLFAPWAWDNFKILVFWYLLVLPGIASACVILWNSHTKYIVRPLIVLILFIQIFSGVLDIWKLALPTATTWQEWGTDATQFAQTIQNFVPINTPITTASVHNSPVVLAGRLMYLGYPAHVWSHGVSPWMREADIKSFFNGTSQTISGEIPRYILVGPQELSSFPNLIIQPQWQLLAEQGEFKLFKNP